MAAEGWIPSLRELGHPSFLLGFWCSWSSGPLATSVPGSPAHRHQIVDFSASVTCEPKPRSKALFLSLDVLLVLFLRRTLTNRTPNLQATPPPSPPSPWQPLTCLLSPWICLFWTFHTSGITQNVVWCLAPFPRHTAVSRPHPSVHLCGRSFSWLHNIPSYGQTTFCLWIRSLRLPGASGGL